MLIIYLLLTSVYAQSYVDYYSHNLQVRPHPEENYYFLEDMHKKLLPLVSEGKMKAFDIGTTVQNRPIWAFEIHKKGFPITRRILIFAAMHAMEWISTESAMQLLLRLSEHPIEGVSFVIIPVVNVDRRLLVEKELREGLRKYRRHNSNNVDLNRDFEINREATAIWRHIFPYRYATSPAPLSQPESQALDQLVQNISFDFIVSLHSFGGYIYYPWAGKYRRTPDQKKLHDIGNIMKQGMNSTHPYQVKQLSHWCFLFRIHGSEIDHFYGKYNIPSFLIELTHTGIVWYKPSTWKDDFRMYNPIDPHKHAQMGADALFALGIYAKKLDE
jgi:hypothetical protein